MKIVALRLALSVLPMGASSLHAARADRIDARVQGRLTGSCGFDQSRDVRFELGDVSALSLPEVGDVGSWVAGDIVTTGCFAVEKILMTFNAPSAATDGHPELFFASGGSKGVAIELQTQDGQAILPNDTNAPLIWMPASQGNRFGLRVRYRRIGALGVGDANACIVVFIDFA
ncbi:type 1 fimbria pilin [Luteibacter rhizovicinus]|uniref:Type 1 fimbria pilin n=1 Tax=Luteibacter rhizovicinus TaxID=242606 RepID=A0A4R3YNH0_9GAMM|nr:fimbrial protein [Luteibacter rhizovicinus]TCV93871.1 type 1 fimbria pilin [Luteibacter rhizovicinus]